MERLISYRLISHGKSTEVKVNCKYYDGCYDLQKFDFILQSKARNNHANFSVILKGLIIWDIDILGIFDIFRISIILLVKNELLRMK